MPQTLEKLRTKTQHIPAHGHSCTSCFGTKKTLNRFSAAALAFLMVAGTPGEAHGQAPAAQSATYQLNLGRDEVGMDNGYARVLKTDQGVLYDSVYGATFVRSSDGAVFRTDSRGLFVQVPVDEAEQAIQDVKDGLRAIERGLLEQAKRGGRFDSEVIEALGDIVNSATPSSNRGARIVTGIVTEGMSLQADAAAHDNRRLIDSIAREINGALEFAIAGVTSAQGRAGASAAERNAYRGPCASMAHEIREAYAESPADGLAAERRWAPHIENMVCNR